MTDYNIVFLDTAPIIYFGKMLEIMQSFIDNETELYTSAITYEEYEVMPLGTGRIKLIQASQSFIHDLGIMVIPIDRNIAAKAASIRAEYTGFKAMDSLQLASAISAKSDLFLTNDKQLLQFKQMTCKTVDTFEF